MTWVAEPPADRFARSFVRLENGCWEWTANRFQSGYGRFWDGERYIRAHRYSYAMHVGPIPTGLVLDHLCRNRACIRPDHLEAVTDAENIRRGISFSAQNRQKATCANGHPFDDANTYRRIDNGKPRRSCRACGRRFTADYRARRLTH